MTGGGFVMDDTSTQSDDNSNQKFTRAVFQVSLLSAIGGFLFGYDTGVVSGAMIYIKVDMKLDIHWQEYIVSVTILGAWIFSLIAAPLATK
jgi:SP family myo-inositol transporter-like MFS transporter 13